MSIEGIEEPGSMAEEEQEQSLPKPQNPSFSWSIWPPTKRTRDAVINRLVETLSSPSVLSKRYGSLSADEAATAARLIEEEAFSAAASASANFFKGSDSDDVGIEILQIYSREISKRMLESAKAKANASSPPDNAQTPPATATSEEISSLESESSQA